MRAGVAHQRSPSIWLARLSARLSAMLRGPHTGSSVPRFFGLLGGIWAAGSLLALWLWNRDLWEDELPPFSARYFWLGLCAVFLCETLAAGLLLAASKALLSRKVAKWNYSGLALLIASCAALSAILFASLVSWTFCAYQLGFLSRSSLVSTLLDFFSIYPFLSFRETFTLAVTFCLSVAMVFALAVTAPPISGRQWLRLNGMLGAGLLTMAICFRIAPEYFLSGVDAERLEGIVQARLLPTATLFWAPLLLPDRYAHLTVTAPLTRRYDFKEYSARIDRQRRRPNILVFAVEALRQSEVERVASGRAVMPTVSRLAAEGVSFTRAYSQSNESLYSMISLISGLHPLKTPGRDRYANIDYPLLRICDLLSPVYHTAFISSSNEHWQNMVNISRSPRLEEFFDADTYGGKALDPDRADTGFYEEVAKGRLRTGTLDDATTTQHLHQWLGGTLDRNDGRPFYAMVSYQSSHYPYEQGFAIPAVFTPNTFSSDERAHFSFVYYPPSATPRMWNRYWNSLAYIDTQIAATLELLRQRRALDNTIVIVHGDHGELFWENGKVTHAAQLYDNTLHIGLVMWGAKDVPAGEYREPVSLLDAGAMLLDVAGMPPYAGFQGMVPPGLRQLAKRPAAENRPVFSTVQNIAFEDSVTVGTWKYVEQANGAYANLFNLAADPREQTNLDRNYPQVSACLRETLREFRRNQFAYYVSTTLKAAYFPPRHRLARVLACEVAFH